ncbi:large ribosomal subunit protein mL53 isoform X1 [Syngnathus scovelli]|uniref:large ribosomal subunit protein mL53 isoform X1 n=1 Tax=Syngnathus scovelli TaxID=161590 RepID=UPI00210F8193|nr:39S ribosomal protein L53, mitochondrial isoform X1 [Syngnathus scovelli]
MAPPGRSTLVLKAVKKIAIHFCPFEANVRSTREFLVVVGSERARLTNSNCEVISMVKHDKSEPVVDVIYDPAAFVFLLSGWREAADEGRQPDQQRDAQHFPGSVHVQGPPSQG